MQKWIVIIGTALAIGTITPLQAPTCHHSWEQWKLRFSPCSRQG